MKSNNWFIRGDQINQNGVLSKPIEVKNIKNITSNPFLNLIYDTLSHKEKHKQCIVFISNKNFVEREAYHISKFIEKNYNLENEELKKISQKILGVISPPTKQCKLLAECIEKGVAFHHSGLASKQREIIEDSFRKGLLKIIVATPTLAYGLNLPAFRVIVKGLRRYNPRWGMQLIPTLEYLQYSGRSGRPGLTEWGESIIVSNESKEKVIEKYIYGVPENIDSKIGVEPVFRIYLLALITGEYAHSIEELEEIFSHTFYAKTYGNIKGISSKIRNGLKKLEEWNFIEKEWRKGTIKPTFLGKRISELYIDPLSASTIIEKINRIKTGTKQERIFMILQLIASLKESEPLLTVRNSELKNIEEELLDRENCLLYGFNEYLSNNYLLRVFKTALMLEAWIEELPENIILERFNARPGEVYSKIEICDWLLYTTSEIMRIKGEKELQKLTQKLRIRVKNGIKEELFQLITLKNIGRIYARRLYNKGYKTISILRDIYKKNKEKLLLDLSNIIKRKDVVKSIIDQLE